MFGDGAGVLGFEEAETQRLVSDNLKSALRGPENNRVKDRLEMWHLSDVIVKVGTSFETGKI